MGLLTFLATRQPDTGRFPALGTKETLALFVEVAGILEDRQALLPSAFMRTLHR